MLKIVIGVILLLLILISSHYIFVESDKEIEQYQNYNDCELDKFNQFITNKHILSNRDELHREHEVPFCSHWGETPKKCCNHFLKDSEDFINRMKNNEILDTTFNRSLSSFQNKHKDIMESCVALKKAEYNDNSIIKSQLPNNISKCENYTNNSPEHLSAYTNLLDYVEDNKDNLAMCSLDSDCNLDNAPVCMDKCYQTIGINDNCGDIDTQYTCSSTIEKKPHFNEEFCRNNENLAECNTNLMCEWDSTNNLCEPRCKLLNRQQCVNNPTCYYNNDTNECTTRICYDPLDNSNLEPQHLSVDYNMELCQKKCVPENNDNCSDRGSCVNDSSNCIFKQFPVCTANN